MVDLSYFRAKSRPSTLTLEQVLTSEDYFGLVTASPLQRAVCRAFDGLPLGEWAEHPDVVASFGGPAAVASLPRMRPELVCLLSGIRCGKSKTAGACAVRSALTCDISPWQYGEPIPRVSVLSFSLDTAKATWEHIRGGVERSSKLRSLLLKEPTADSLVLRHPSGVGIEIKVVAGSRAAGSLGSRWSAGVIFDEAPKMLGQEDAVVNIDDSLHEMRGRMLPGAQIQLIGSPWAPIGPTFDLVEEFFGRPSPERVIVRAPAWRMNPAWWTPERCEDERTKSPDAYATNVECQFRDPVAGLFTIDELKDVTRDQPMELPANSRFSYCAAMDPATRGNGWALIVTTNLGHREGRELYSVALAKQWVGSRDKPLKPREVFREMAELLRPYGVNAVLTDQWSIDSLRDHAHDAGLALIERTLTRDFKYEMFDALKKRVVDKSIELAPSPLLLRDLGSVRKIVTQQGMYIDLPEGSDGRHADYAVALSLALSRALWLPQPEPLPPEEQAKEDQNEMRRQAARRAKRMQQGVWRDY